MPSSPEARPGGRTPGPVAIDPGLPGAAGLRDLFAAWGHPAELFGGDGGFAAGGPAALLLALGDRAADTVHFAESLRRDGYGGVILVLGRAAAPLEVRWRLAAARAWYASAFCGPADLVSRVRQMLP